MQSTNYLEMKFVVFASVAFFFLNDWVGGNVFGELKNQLMSYSIHDGTGVIQGKIYISQNNNEIASM